MVTVLPKNYSNENDPLNQAMVNQANTTNPSKTGVFQGPRQSGFGFNTAPSTDVATQSSPAPQTIEATDIGTESVTTPAIPTLDVSGQVAEIQAGIDNVQSLIDQRNATATGETALSEGTTAGAAPATRAGNFSDQILQEYFNEISGGFEQSPETTELQTEAAEANLALRNLTTQMSLYDKETKDELYRMSKNPEGKSMGANAAAMENYKYERYARPGGAADMAIEAQFALNNAQYAYEIANNAVEAEQAAYDRKVQGLYNLYGMAQNDMTVSERMQYESQLRMYENQVTSLMDSKEEAMQRAATAGAPEDVINGIRRANSTSEVWEAAGIYGEDPSLKQQREQFEMNYALNWSKFDWERQKYAQDQEIKNLLEAQAISAQEALDAQTRNDALYEGGLYLTSIQDATKNLKGLFEATGTTAIGRIAPFSGDKSRFLTSAKYLLNNETFKKLAAITENTSLGAISEGELKLVQAAATKLGGYAIYDDKGNLTGFDGAHEDVLAAVIELQDAQERYMDKIRIGALSPEEYNALGGTGNYPQPENALTRAEQIIADHKKAAAEAAGFGGAGMF